MSLRHVTRRVAASGTAIAAACAMAILGTSSLAGAAIVSGNQVPGAAAAVAPFTANTPFSSGQNINVVVPANTVFSPSTGVNIVECSAPGLVLPSDPATCDGNTINGSTVFPNSDGSINFQTATGGLYTVYALPDSILLGETPGGPACSTTVPCVLYIGDNQTDFTQPHVWSQFFFIAANADDGGENPGDGSAPPVVTTTTTLAASPTSSVFGQSVTLTATVSTSTPTSCTPSGPVTFSNGGTSLGTGTISSGKATLTTSSLPVGTDSLTASFPGSGGCPSSASTATPFVVSQASTTTALTAAPAGGSIGGQSVTFTATVTPVSPGAGHPSGSVTFKDGSTTLGTGTVSATTGQATFTTSTLANGSHSMSAVYGGDTNFTTSTGTLTYSVGLASTTTTVTAVPASPAVFGQSVTFTATVAPVAPATATPTGTVTFKDGATQIGTTQTLSGSGTASVSTSSLAVASHTITATYSGSSGDNGSSGTLTYVVNKASSSVTLTAAPTSPSTFGQSVTFTATVAAVAPGAGAPSGTVTFTDGTTTLGTGTLSSGKATFSTSSLAAGTHSITASYGGDTNFAVAASSATPYVVSNASTASTLTSSVNPSTPGQSVTFTDTVAAVAPGAGTPAGTVTFKDGATSIGTGTLSGGVATLSTSTLALGTHPITAVYAAAGSFNGSTSNTVNQVVATVSSTTTLTSSVNPSTPGQSVTFTATVTASSGTPTGTVTFNDGTTSIGTGTISSGKATLTTSTLAVGTHPITAVYGGTSSISGSTSNVIDQVVATVSSTTTLTSSVNPSVPGQAVTFTATVTSSAGTPTGTVTFNDGTTSIGTGTLNGGGQATLTTSTLALGTHPISAVYAGTSSIGGSTSNTVNQVVATATSTTTLTSSVNPSTPGQSVTFTATVTASAGTPTGTVTFNDGTTSIGTGTLNGTGQATLTTSTLALGTHPISAVYAGTSAIGGSTSNTVSQVVALLSSTTNLTSSANPSAPGQSVTFTATVTASGTTPTGTVTFSDGVTPLGTGTLSAGQATLTTSTLALGTHPITAVYGGSPSVSGSTSNTVNQVVASIATTTVLTSSANPSGPGQAVTFTAKVTPASGATPTGTVTFKDGTTVLGTGTLNAAGQATFTTSALAIGTHPITAVYAGAGSDLGSTSAVLNQVVTRLATKLVAVAQVTLLPPSNIAPNVQATLTAGGLPVVGQLITFTVGTTKTVLCSGYTSAAGVAICTPSATGELELILSNGYEATFTGTSLYQPSVGKAPFFVV